MCWLNFSGHRGRKREVRLTSRVTHCPHPSRLPHHRPWGLLQLNQSRAPGSPGLWHLLVPPQAVLESQLGVTQHWLQGVLGTPSICWPRVGSMKPHTRLRCPPLRVFPPFSRALGSVTVLGRAGPLLSIPAETSLPSARPPQRDSTTVPAVSAAGSGSCSGLQSPSGFTLSGALHFLAPSPPLLGTKGPTGT